MDMRNNKLEISERIKLELKRLTSENQYSVKYLPLNHYSIKTDFTKISFSFRNDWLNHLILGHQIADRLKRENNRQLL